MIVQMETTPNSTSTDRAQQLYSKTIELEKKRQKSLQAKLPLDPNAWYEIRENYEAIILEDHAFSQKNNIEFFLWQLHYKRIEEFRGLYNNAQALRSSTTINGRTPLHQDRMSKIRGQFKAFLSESTGFYHDLILKIRAKHGLPLGHFSEDFENEGSISKKEALISCHHCLIYLGDLARYKGLYGEGESRVREFSVASSYYMQASSLWRSNGNSHHQLAILSTYSNDELVAVYRYFRSLAIEVPFATAKENLLIAFDKNRQSYTQLIETTKLTDREVSIKEKYKEFCIQFVRLNGILFTRTSLETFSDVLSSMKASFIELLSFGQEESLNFGKDFTENGLFFVRLVAILIFTVFNTSKKNEGQSYAEILQYNLIRENARSLTFEVMILIVEKSLQLLDPTSSFLLPCISVFLEWLTSCRDFATNTFNEKKPSAIESSFWKHCIVLLNKLLSSHLVDDDGESESQLSLTEDFELRGFLPLLPGQNNLDFSRKQLVGFGGTHKEKQTRVKRIIVSGRALTNIAMVDNEPVSFDSKVKQFVIGFQLQVSDNKIPGSYVGGPPEVVAIATSSINFMKTRENAELLFEGDDEGEEIVFKPMFAEKKKDYVGPTWVFPKESKPGRTTPPISSPWLIEQKNSLEGRMNNLRFVENNHELKRESKGSSGFSNGGSNVPPSQPSVSLMNTSIEFSDYRRGPEPMIPSNMDFSTFSGGLTDKLSSLASASSNSQLGQPVRHIGPPPGFSSVPSKHISMPMSSNVVGNLEFPFLQNPGNSHLFGNMNGSNGNPGLPFLGIQGYGVELQGGKLNNYLEFQNMNPNFGHKLFEQHHVMTGNQKFTSRVEDFHGQSTWNGQYRV